MNHGAWIMSRHRGRHELDAETLILGLGYVTGLLILVGWVATIVA